MRNGTKIVLTASAVEMSDFRLNPFTAFLGGFPIPLPTVMKKWLFYPPTPDNGDGTAKFAPYGLRKVEALLIEAFGEENVATVHPDRLNEFVGPGTKVVGISSMDPLGMGFVSRTYTGLMGLTGKPMTREEFERLLGHPVLKKHRPKIVVGGSGAWQIVRAGLQKELGIDVIVIGQAEGCIVDIFSKLIRGEPVEPVVYADLPDPSTIPIIKKPSLYGTVEITRGCGRNCAFCSPTMRRRISFPLERIMKEVELNASHGTRMILLQTDDVFLYKVKPRFIPNREAVSELIHRVGSVEGVELIQIAHAALAPVVCDRELVEDIAPVLVEKAPWKCRGRKCASVEVGIETGSVRLFRKHMAGKALPFRPEEWPDVVVKAVEIMNDNDICPLATILVGLPGEEEEDTKATLDLIEALEGAKIFFVPLLFTAEEETKLRHEKHKYVEELTDLQLELFAECWGHNRKVWGNKRLTRSLKVLGAAAYNFYYRWKHGPRIKKPLAKVIGLMD
mgnify:CR=1 FL=1